MSAAPARRGRGVLNETVDVLEAGHVFLFHAGVNEGLEEVFVEQRVHVKRPLFTALPQSCKRAEVLGAEQLVRPLGE